MPYHPADGPRLNTLYVTHSTRKRRRRTNSRRRRRNALIAATTLVVVAVAGAVFRKPLTHRVNLWLGHKPSAFVKDVTRPTATVQQAGSPLAAQPTQPAVVH